MRRIVAIGALAGFLSLLHAADARAGAGQAGDPSTGKTSGPAVSITVVMNPTFESPTKGQTAVRLSKGPAYSGALFQHREATAPATDWELGCDSILGADPNSALFGDFNLNSLTAVRFVNNRIRSWIPSEVMGALFGQLGVAFNDSTRIPVITDVDNVQCTTVPRVDRSVTPPVVVGTDYFLSFSGVIQLEAQ